MASYLSVRCASGMTKANVTDRIESFIERKGGTALRGDRHFFSVLVASDASPCASRLNITVNSPITTSVMLYTTEHVPVVMPSYTDSDDDYISKEPGIYPDILRPATAVYTMNGKLAEVYVEVHIPRVLAPGKYPITLHFTWDGETEDAASVTYTVEVLDALLPALDMTVTHWFHYDSLALEYGVKVFSEKHWELIENYLTEYVSRGSNALLTPIFTPPLDTKVGGERPTVQLVDVSVKNGKYHFGFSKLRRFCNMCRRVGIRDLEIAHFFTQWGAAHAPKIVATVDGEKRRIFGWETDASGEEYVRFLRTLIPKLRAELDKCGYRGHYFFHISDEPTEEHFEQYTKAKAGIIDLIEDCPVRDALSHVDFYNRGIITAPIPATDHAEDFLAANVPDLWVYYCCVQHKEVSNQFVAMPGYRTRVIGAQFFKHNITGFLQWGYNFYFNRYSIDKTNPFVNLEGDMFTPAGDCFLVYPGKDGRPLHSLRELIFEQALLDVRAMQAAAKKAGREAVIAAIDAEGEIDFKHYPRNEDYLLRLRDAVNRMAAE